MRCRTKTTHSCFVCGHGFFCSEECVAVSTTMHKHIHHQDLPSNTAHDLMIAILRHTSLLSASEAHRDYRFCDIDDETQRLQLYVVYEQVFRAACWCSHLVDKWRKEKVLGDKACGQYERLPIDILSRDWACANRGFLNGEDVEYTKMTEPVVSSDQEEDDSDDNDESDDEKMGNSDKEMDIPADDNAN